MLLLGNVRFRYEKSIISGNITKEDDRLLIKFRYHEKLKDEIKALEAVKWHGFDPTPRKIWSVKDTSGNRFQLAYLTGQNPYAPYDIPLIEFKPRRSKCYNHQIETSAFILTRRQCIIAEEMGVGKTLAAIEAMEASGIRDWLWVGPRSALDSVRYEFRRWESFIRPTFLTYEEMKKFIGNNLSQKEVPKGVIFDECQRIKNPTSQRGQAAYLLSEDMRQAYGREAFIVLMSGTPAPKDPSDWFNLAKVACPGFLREGDLTKFKNRLAKVEPYESASGGTFMKLVTWWDNPLKCQVCSKFEDDPNHDNLNIMEEWYHPFKKSIDEVSNLYKRLAGLTIVKFKKGLIDLPEKIFRIIKCTPSDSTLRTANTILKTACSAIKGMILCRELSDGFQYTEVENGEEKCPACKGSLKTKTIVDADDPDNPLDSESLTKGHRAIWDNESFQIVGFKDEPLKLVEKEIDCTNCDGIGQVIAYQRDSIRVPCPKDHAIINLLDQYEDEGRVVIWAAFTDSVERNVETCLKAGWPVIRLDGRGWWSNMPQLMGLGKEQGVEILTAFDNKKDIEKMAFVGQPGAGGLGLNLTASSMEVFYSNTFKSDDRAQAIDRIHRPGADHQRGCMIYDLIHLPQDLMVLNNNRMKRDLEQMTMGTMKAEIEKAQAEFERML